MYSKRFLENKWRVISLAGVLFSGLVFAQGPTVGVTSQYQQSLLQKVRVKKQINVIVTPKVALDNGVSRAASLGLSRTKRIVDLQQKVLGRLDQSTLKRVKLFDAVAQMALSVDEQNLQTLLQDNSISVSEDVLRKPLLSLSVPRVYPSRDLYPYHGDNEWAVAVLDSGVDKSHPFLAGTVISEACYSDGGGQAGTTSLCPGAVTSTVATGSGVDCNSTVAGCDHGTQIAGIVAGDGSSFDGVARDAKLISIQIYSRVDDVDFCFPNTSCIGSYTSDLIAGLQRVYDLRNSYKIAAVNISLGSGLFFGACDTQPEKPIIDLLKSVKIATVIASGNDGSNGQLSAPACISSAIAVGSTLDTADVRSTFSNNGVMLDLYAPGESITSSVPGGGYAAAQGTSSAAAHVSGAWAVMRHRQPTATVDQIQTLLKTHGPVISVSGVSRRRIDIRSVLNTLSPPPLNPATVIPPILLLLLE